MFTSICIILMVSLNGSVFREVIDKIKILHVTTVPCVRKLHKKHFDTSYKNAKLLIRLLTILCILAFFSAVFFSSFMIYVLDSSIEYPLPLFYEIYFVPVVDWPTFIFNFVYQSLIAVVIILSLHLIGTKHFMISSIIFGKQDVIREMVQEMPRLSQELGSHEAWVKLVTENLEEYRP